MSKYDPRKIEKKWQKVWESKKPYKAVDGADNNFFALMEFPYPSGEGLHTGHVRGYTAMDIVARKRRMQGFNVMFPIGWDAFGLPTENFAIKTGIAPEKVTKTNTDTFRKQFKSLGMSFDWSREINTTDPKYYKWTQWIFLQFLKNGLAYKTKSEINWCPKDKIGLANEEVVNGCCERCGTPVEKKEKEQWMLAITKYAERLHKDLDDVDYPERVKIQQRNWIGKSEGAEIDFPVSGNSEKIKVYTTRPDTIFGATYMVLAPEHQLVQVLMKEATNKDEIARYIEQTKKRTEIERTTEGKQKTGAELKGVMAINPATKKEIPIWIADYVLSHYGTGAIMAVPSDDERDAEFAQKYNLPIIKDYKPAGFEDFGKKVIRFKLRDWVFSRQRYWGEPIPVIHCDSCGIVPVPEKDLPVKLPKVKKYSYTETGESPLAAVSSWVNTKCPKCGGKAKRETDTMPNWAGSSWYFLRYTDPKNTKEFASEKALKNWMPIDWYNGGMEHTTLHLLYSRFWNKFLFDQKLVPTSEPYKKRTSHGLILAEGGVKMSKSLGNVVNPDEIVKNHGADTLRLYEMFMGPFEQAVAWSTDGIVGPHRFLERVFALSEKVKPTGKLVGQDVLEKTIEKVSKDIEEMSFNTAIAQLMICADSMKKEEVVPQKDFARYLQVLSPFAPHITEELWHLIGMAGLIGQSIWPEAKEVSLSQNMKIAVQINGKVRGTVNVSEGDTEDTVKSKVIGDEQFKKHITSEIKKVIYIPRKIINIVL
ncbi:MAG: class I tRNA ligase family protein [Minisyncoccia bacterium]